MKGEFLKMLMGVSLMCGLFAAAETAADKVILWEAHRGGGGGYEMPESCCLSFEYGWLHGGRPEADINLTKDGVMVSLHDSNLNRIGRNLPEQFRDKPISEITWAELQTIDIGWDAYPNQHVPSMEMLFKRLQQFPDRHMIIDYKMASLEQLAELIRRYDVGRQITLASWNRQLLRRMKELVPEIRTKHWIGGSVQEIMDEFHVDQKENFAGITEVQLHLNNLDHAKAAGTWRYELPRDFATEALDATLKAGVLLQVLPWEFEQADIAAILDTGIRSFAVDYPHKFTQSCAVYFGGKWQ